MDRGAWWAAAHGVAVVGHDSATKPHHRPGELEIKQESGGWHKDLQNQNISNRISLKLESL